MPSKAKSYLSIKPIQRHFCLVVKNLSNKVSWQDLKDYTSQFGEVKYAEAHRIKKNEGFVEFLREKDMKTALEKLNGTLLGGTISIDNNRGRKTEPNDQYKYSRSNDYYISRSGTKQRKEQSNSKDIFKKMELKIENETSYRIRTNDEIVRLQSLDDYFGFMDLEHLSNQSKIY